MHGINKQITEMRCGENAENWMLKKNVVEIVTSVL
jgi:hypothetical protein